jgi:hypothetical protein
MGRNATCARAIRRMGRDQIPFAMEVTTASMNPPCAMLRTNSQLM